ncbi:MAG: NTP transferase domain-containing protein [Alphaproteobacteria bacterium]|nr:NTP transferase domain-containing protein [Alphaproteobacteria bacterium]
MPTATAQKVRVVILAGRRPEGDPVADMFNVEYKAAVRIGERAMLNRVMDAIDNSGRVLETFILTQEPGQLSDIEDFVALKARDDVHFVKSGGSICGSLINFLDSYPSDTPTLITTSDHVLLRGEDIRTFLDHQPTDADISLALVEDQTVLAEHPTAKRTWLKFAGGAFTTCNLFMLTSPAARDVLAFWAEVEHDRKRVLRLAWRFGPFLFIGFLLRLLTLDRAFARASKALGARIRPVVLQHAHLSIDVDKPTDVKLAQDLLET